MAAGSNSDLQEMPPMSAPASLFIGWLAAFGAVVVWSGWVVVSRLGIIQTLIRAVGVSKKRCERKQQDNKVRDRTYYPPRLHLISSFSMHLHHYLNESTFRDLTTIVRFKSIERLNHFCHG